MTGWPHDSHDSLTRSGFLYRCEVECRRCGARILIYGKPSNGGAVALERFSFLPHRWRCPPKPTQRRGDQASLFEGTPRPEAHQPCEKNR